MLIIKTNKNKGLNTINTYGGFTGIFLYILFLVGVLGTIKRVVPGGTQI